MTQILVHSNPDQLIIQGTQLCALSFINSLNMLLLNPLNLPHFLLNHQLITPDDLVTNRFTIHQQSSRNINYIINKKKENGLFIKQIRTLDAEKIHTLKREATCYWLGSHHPSFTEWKDMMPSYNFYDFNNHILVSSFIDALSLDSFITTLQIDMPSDIPIELAQLLNKCHKPSLKEEMLSNYKKYFPAEIPYVLKMAEDLFNSSWRENEVYRKDLLELIRSDQDYLNQTNKIIKSWQKSAVIHSDIKFQNILINNQNSLKIIDWETCDIGDPLWDVSAVFHMYLIAWMNFELKGEQPDTNTNICMISKNTMQKQIQLFWGEYGRLKAWDNRQSNLELHKTLEFCSMKLMHTCFEIINQAKKLDSYITQILQLSINILKDKESIISDLLKIESR